MACAAVTALLVAAPSLVAQPEAGRAAASSESAQATRGALSQLKTGGNAIDAAVTAALIAGVTSPTSSGIGGGGFALVWDASKKQPLLVDFRETAPAAIQPALFESRPLQAKQRGQLTGVPGEVAGLYELHSRLGRKSWNDVVAPAAQLARSGFKVETHLGNMLAQNGSLKQDAGLARVFFPGGKAALSGQVLHNPKLAATLTHIAQRGPRAFYEGPIAQDIVESARAIGGALTLEELKAYRPTLRTPLRVAWGGFEVLTMPPPSAGGVMLAQALKLFSKQTLRKLQLGSGAYTHVLAEAMRGSIADRLQFVGDPELTADPAPKLLSSEWLARRARLIAVDRTHRLPRYAEREAGTHHLLVADAQGNLVSLTTTVNRLFGVKATTAQSGIVLNDQLDDFTEQSDVVEFGLTESPNRPRPGARPVSSMTPSIVIQGDRAVLGIGGSGGPTIATNVTQLTLAMLAFDKSPAEAVALPRFYLPSSGPTLLLEAGAPEALVNDLKWRGEVVATMPFKTSAVQILQVLASGEKRAAADARKHGAAATE